MVNEITESELIRLFTVQRQPELMLFLGSGTSASSGIPTAYEMIWEFKRAIYCSEKNISPENFKDLSIEDTQKILQEYMNTKDWYKKIQSDKEYSLLFETAYPNAISRKQYIEKRVLGSIPGLGYRCLGEMIECQKISNIITTNFDDLIEKSLPSNTKTTFYIISPETSKTRASDTKINNINPQLFKLHGDFKYDKLQNTVNELQTLEQELEKRLFDFFKEYGVIFIGYSGRDESVIKMLNLAIENKENFKKGFYWCILNNEIPNQFVQKILKDLNDSNRPAHLIKISDFDEFMYKLSVQSNTISNLTKRMADERYVQTKSFTFNIGKTNSNEIIKINTLKIKEYPSTLYQFNTNITQWDEFDKIIGTQNVIAALNRGNVYAIGDRTLIEKLFDGKILNSINPFHVLEKHFIDDTFVINIHYKLLDLIFQKSLNFKFFGKRTKSFYIQENASLIKTSPLKNVKIIDEYRVGSNNYFAHLAFQYKLQYRNSELFIVINPTFVITKDKITEADDLIRKTIINKALATKYNKAMNECLDFWLHMLKNGNKNLEFCLLDEKSSILAKYVLENNFSFSYLES